MRNRLGAIKAGNAAFAFIDAATARIVEEPDEDGSSMTDDELLAALLDGRV
jgi:hypothetical protein